MNTPDIRKIHVDIPVYWTDEEAVAVFELIDDLRNRILAYYGPRIAEQIAQDRDSDDEPLEINDDDLPF